MTRLACVFYLCTVSLFAHSQAFHGYPCTQDCSGHEAGYAWAESQGIRDPDDCVGNSPSFIEGCRAYAEENASSTEEDDEEDEDN